MEILGRAARHDGERAILGNVGTLIAFRVGVRDAKVLVDEFFPEIRIEDLVSLPAYEIYLRLMVDGGCRGGSATRRWRQYT